MYSKAEISGKITKAVPFLDSYGRFGVRVTAKTGDSCYLCAKVTEPSTEVIIKGHEVTFRGKITKTVNYGSNKVIIMNYADAYGKKQEFFKGYAYQPALF